MLISSMTGHAHIVDDWTCSYRRWLDMLISSMAGHAHIVDDWTWSYTEHPSPY